MKLLVVVCLLVALFSQLVECGCPCKKSHENFGTTPSFGNYHSKPNEAKPAFASIPVPRIGYQAPAFTAKAVLPDKSFGTVSLSDYAGKWVVLFFYPLDFTFVCPTEIVAFSDAQTQFNDLNTVVLGVSVDSVYSHLAWINTDRKNGGLGQLQIPLLEDITKKMAVDYGVLHMDSGHSNRGLLIIDPAGKIRHITMNDPPVGRNVAEIVRLVEAYQFVEENGEVCPINWTKGKPTMKPDPVMSKEYFTAHAN